MVVEGGGGGGMPTSIQACLLCIECQDFNTDVHRNHVHIVDKTIGICLSNTITMNTKIKEFLHEIHGYSVTHNVMNV